MTTVILLVLLLILGAAQTAKLYGWPRPAGPTPEPPLVIEARVREAVYRAAVHQGLNTDAWYPEMDLLRTGKLQDILMLASADLSIDHGLHTVGDVCAYLQRRA